MRVEARGDQNQLRSELERRGQDDVLEKRKPDFAVGPRIYREVDRVPLAHSGARIGQPPGARIYPPLVDACEQHVRPVSKDLCRSIAVMDVPVENEHALQPVVDDG